MYEHYENYERYIPDVMLKKHKKHEEYLSNAYAGMSHEEIYKSKLGTVEDAIGLIESGDCIVWSIHGSEPRLFLRNLHRIADRIDPNNPVELWSCVDRWGSEYQVHSNPELKDSSSVAPSPAPRTPGTSRTTASITTAAGRAPFVRM